MTELRAVEELLYREALYLDRQDWQRWLGLYTEDCEYWVPAEPGQTDAKNHISLFFEDRTLMETRVKRLLHPAALSLMPPLRTSHIIGNILPAEDGDDDLTVHSSFHLLEYRGETHRLLGGRYTHRLRRDGDALKIRAKRVDLVNCDGVFEILQLFL